MENQVTEKIQKDQEKLSDFASAFGQEAPATLIEDKDTYEFFYLWEESSTLYEIYKIAKLYMNEFYGLPENILIKLIEEKGLTFTESLANIPYIHNGYLSIISPAEESDG